MTRDEVLDQAEEAVAKLIDSYTPSVRKARNLEQMASVYRDYQRDRERMLQPYIEMLYLMPLDPVVIPKEMVQ